MKASTKINNLQKQIIKFGGFDVKTAENTSQKTVNILSQYSILLLVPMIIGLFSSAYAAYTISNNILISSIVGLIWCSIIYIIDRAILSTNPSTNFGGNTLVRIFLAITLSTLFAEPIVLLVFEDSIQEAQHQEFIISKSPIDNEYKIALGNNYSLESESLQKTERLQQIYTGEMDGSMGSRVRNQGPIYKQKYNDYLIAKEQHETTANNLKQDRQYLKEKYENDIISLKNVQATSLAGRFDTLHSLDSTAVKFGIWVIRFALIFLELIPLIIKLKKSDGWDSYWHQVQIDNQEVNAVYSNNSEYRVKALNKDAQIKHAATMKMLDKEAIQGVMNHDFSVLEMQMDNVVKAHELITVYKKSATTKFANDPTLLNTILKEFDDTFGEFKLKTIKVELNK